MCTYCIFPEKILEQFLHFEVSCKWVNFKENLVILQALRNFV